MATERPLQTPYRLNPFYRPPMEEVREESSCNENLTNYQHGLSPATITSSNVRNTLGAGRLDASPQSFMNRREERLSQQFLPSYHN